MKPVPSVPKVSITELVAAQAPLFFGDASSLATDVVRILGANYVLAVIAAPGWWCAGIVVSLLVLAFVSMTVLVGCLGRMAKRYIEQHDRELVGTDVTVGRVQINPFTACIRLSDVKVMNPAGTAYLSEHMLTAEYMKLNIGLRAFLWSRGQRVVVQQLILQNMQTLVEKHSIRTSNIKELLDILGEDNSSSPDSGQGTQAIEDGQRESLNMAGDAPDATGTVVLRQLMFKGISVKLQIEGASFGFGERRLLAAHTLALNDIVYEDFDAQVGSSDPSELIKVVLRCFLKSIAAEIGGRELSDRWL